MARKVRDRQLDTREERRKLKPGGKPYWRIIERELHLGYRRLRGKSGTWWARHYIGKRQYEVEAIGIADDLSDADGKKVLDFFQAQAKVRERMVSRLHRAAGRTGPLTVKEAVESYLGWLEGSRKSALDARHRAAAFIYPALGDQECGKLIADQLRKWHAGLAKQLPRMRTGKGKKQQHRAFDGSEEAIRRRRSSANRVLTILKAALNHAFDDGKIASDAEWRKVRPFKGVDAARLRYLTVAEAQRLVSASDSEFRPLVQAALQTGARYGELIRLEVHDFNSDSGTLVIRQSKSSKSRYIMLTDEGIALFRNLTAGRVGGELILRRNGGKPWKASHQGRPMRDACTRAKIDPPISIHALRHTWASLAVMGGMERMVVAKNLGHVDTRMVERHYGHLADTYITQQIRKHAPQFNFEPDKAGPDDDDPPQKTRDRHDGSAGPPFAG